MERGHCGCPRLALPGVGDAGGDMSEEEEGAKGCRFAFGAEVVIYAEYVHICVHGACMDWLSAWVGWTDGSQLRDDDDVGLQMGS